MSKSLVEAYAKRIQIAESVYSKAHNGEQMDNNKKTVLAVCLNNTKKFLGEALDSAVGTQRSDLGMYKRFCTNLVNVAIPNLIAPDLVITKPMTSMAGFLTYLEYSASTTKGATEQGEVFNSPFALHKVDSSYTSQAVSEVVASASAAYKPIWQPTVTGAFTVITVDGTVVEFDPRATYTAAELATKTTKDVKIVAATTGTVTFADYDSDGKVPTSALSANCTVAYKYDNVVIPQNDIPRIKAELKNIPLVAKARRIAIYYSQIAAFQSKTDYGFELGDSLAEQAVGRLQYEIDTEVVELLDKTAGSAQSNLVWSKTLPVGVNKRDHYAGFAEKIEDANTILYNRTQRFQANWMIIASDVKPVLVFIDGFKAASTTNINGPYFCGTLNGVKVYVSPALESGKYLLGVNGNDYMSAVAVYAPYLPVVPTQLLQFDDGGSAQGFSTMYDLQVLNSDLVVAGQITE